MLSLSLSIYIFFNESNRYFITTNHFSQHFIHDRHRQPFSSSCPQATTGFVTYPRLILNSIMTHYSTHINVLNYLLHWQSWFVCFLESVYDDNMMSALFLYQQNSVYLNVNKILHFALQSHFDLLIRQVTLQRNCFRFQKNNCRKYFRVCLCNCFEWCF